MIHKSVLLQESIDGLHLENKGIFVDATYGAGGHSRYVREKYPNISIIAFDQDPNVSSDEVELIHKNFREIDSLGRGFDAILFDLGTSVDQIKESGRGFTFERDEPLLMNMSGEGITAKDILNNWDEETIKTILRAYGDEKFSGRIAREVVASRPIETTLKLVDVVKRATPKFYHFKKIHPATKTFQALRIAVNDEFSALREGLQKSFGLLNPGGRMAVISFHSLEDREVKKFFRKLEDEGLGKRVTKKPIVAAEEERKENPRSRSAKLRIFEKND
ncbi:MAG: 16S rRNA (cytosine(1402)-N(4))-methyltransferase RsmH [Candidatus Pacebacteria bacterium]|nr:16S rRNA (cytosine(1402)-N(4))-methyltransferase RsmH [Candidatus Paceibacterota bacterium]